MDDWDGVGLRPETPLLSGWPLRDRDSADVGFADDDFQRGGEGTAAVASARHSDVGGLATSNGDAGNGFSVGFEDSSTGFGDAANMQADGGANDFHVSEASDGFSAGFIIASSGFSTVVEGGGGGGAEFSTGTSTTTVYGHARMTSLDAGLVARLEDAGMEASVEVGFADEAGARVEHADDDEERRRLSTVRVPGGGRRVWTVSSVAPTPASASSSASSSSSSSSLEPPPSSSVNDAAAAKRASGDAKPPKMTLTVTVAGKARPTEPRRVRLPLPPLQNLPMRVTCPFGPPLKPDASRIIATPCWTNVTGVMSTKVRHPHDNTPA